MEESLYRKIKEMNEQPLGLLPKKIHDEQVKAERFNEVCGAISRYYDAGLKINLEWIVEYNEFVESYNEFVESAGKLSGK